MHIDGRRVSQAKMSTKLGASKALVVTTQETALFIVTAVRTSTPT
jgi:hypothetical protein